MKSRDNIIGEIKDAEAWSAKMVEEANRNGHEKIKKLKTELEMKLLDKERSLSEKLSEIYDEAIAATEKEIKNEVNMTDQVKTAMKNRAEEKYSLLREIILKQILE